MKNFIAISLALAVVQCAPQLDTGAGGGATAEVNTTTVQVSQDPALPNVYLAGGSASASEEAMHSERLLTQSQAHHVESKDARAEITEQNFDMIEPGKYSYHFRTNNGIEMVEVQDDAEVKKGSFAFIAPDGQTYKVEYVADELGFHPVGSHLPVAPPIPVAIMRSLEYNAQHPEEEKECVDCQ